MRFAMLTKDRPAQFKAPPTDLAADDPQAGVFEAVVSVFGNVDAVNDIVMPGAFKASLAAWEASGDPIPVLWRHRDDDPAFNIGAVLDADELAPGDDRVPSWASPWIHQHGGLWVRAALDVGADASSVATRTRMLLTKRRVTKFSFAYEILQAKINDAGQQELHQLWLHEASPVLVGANDATELLGAKHGADSPSPVPPHRPGAADTRLRCEIAAWELTG